MNKLLIFYPYFLPAYKAGGPVQSLFNMASLLSKDYQVFVICSAFDLGDKKPLPNILINKWNSFANNIAVFYSSTLHIWSVYRAIKTVKPDTIYINGLFLISFNFWPLILTRNSACKIVVAPRGMLQKGAFAIRSTKKQIYLQLLIWLRLHKNIIWHATDDQERVDIMNRFGMDARVKLAPNIPKPPVKSITLKRKDSGTLSLVYLSLITEKKNLHLILEALREVNESVSFDIWGPITDGKYWNRCQLLMKDQIHKIQYHGVVKPNQVQELLSQYHALILPTSGENFGHAIYESFSVGTPAIISAFTPWGNLEDKRAGITHELSSKSLAHAIREFISLDSGQFAQISSGAYKVACDYYQQHDYQKSYHYLFKE